MVPLRQAAKYMGVTPEAIFNRVRRGTCPQAFKVKGRWYVPEEFAHAYRDSYPIRHAYTYMRKKGGFICKDSMYNHIQTGQLKAFRCPLGKIRIHKKELDRWLGIPERKAAKRAQRLVQP